MNTYDLIGISTTEPERIRGVLALAGIQNLPRDTGLVARLSADSRDRARARVVGALEREPDATVLAAVEESSNQTLPLR
jgi:hypothetical protein